MKKMIATALLLGAGVLTMSLSACGHSDSLIGTWQATSRTDTMMAALQGKQVTPETLRQSGTGSMKFIFSADKVVVKVEGQPETIGEVKYLKGTSGKNGTSYQLIGKESFGPRGATAVVAPNGDTATLDLGVATFALKRE